MINEQIRDREVRLVDSDGSQLGIVQGREAQHLADSRHMDLVKIAPTAKPPVCKIMDYGKYRFESAKKLKEARKKQKTVEVKEVQLTLNIGIHDLNFKQKRAEQFLKEGDKVKVSLRFYGREIVRPESAYELLNKFAKGLEDCSTLDRPPKLESRNLSMFLAPKAPELPKVPRKSDQKTVKTTDNKEIGDERVIEPLNKNTIKPEEQGNAQNENQ